MRLGGLQDCSLWLHGPKLMALQSADFQFLTATCLERLTRQSPPAESAPQRIGQGSALMPNCWRVILSGWCLYWLARQDGQAGSENEAHAQALTDRSAKVSVRCIADTAFANACTAFAAGGKLEVNPRGQFPCAGASHS